MLAQRMRRASLGLLATGRIWLVDVERVANCARHVGPNLSGAERPFLNPQQRFRCKWLTLFNTGRLERVHREQRGELVGDAGLVGEEGVLVLLEQHAIAPVPKAAGTVGRNVGQRDAIRSIRSRERQPQVSASVETEERVARLDHPLIHRAKSG